MNDELTRLRNKNLMLRALVNRLGTENHKLEVMLETVLQTKSRAVDLMAREAIEKARKS